MCVPCIGSSLLLMLIDAWLRTMSHTGIVVNSAPTLQRPVSLLDAISDLNCLPGDHDWVQSRVDMGDSDSDGAGKSRLERFGDNLLIYEKDPTNQFQSMLRTCRHRASDGGDGEPIMIRKGQLLYNHWAEASSCVPPGWGSASPSPSPSSTASAAAGVASSVGSSSATGDDNDGYALFPTIVGKNNADGWHPLYPRAFTVRERARACGTWGIIYLVSIPCRPKLTGTFL